MKRINKLLHITLFFFLLVSCGESVKEEETNNLPVNEQQEEPEPETEELPVTEETAVEKTEVGDEDMVYKFDVDLPRSWKWYKLGEETLDYSNYEATLPDGFKVLDINVLLNSRFNASNIQDLYEAALKSGTLEISYQTQKGNWFVISGIDKKTGNIIYWKRVYGEMYVGDLRFEYPRKKEAEIAPHIGSIAKSFTCD